MSKNKESFVVSARKYRPASWDEVIGQSAITETLHNAIDQDHLAHAYLFCGPRGVGKTTCARIFAKEINREDGKDEQEDFSFNIFELDAASNNSVNDIRSLTDQVRIPPQVGKYKVYIIDEVHMLSPAAFNAFLKTLEEPPKHAIFILATTEKHKIIPTILSRCQIYDFNRISVEDIAAHLESICKKEQYEYEEEALHIIGQKADGALRDALSILDQLASFTHQKLTYESVLKNLHVLDYDYYFKVTDALVNQSYPDALMILDDILQQGFDGNHFVSGLADHFRDLLVCKDSKTLELLEVGQSVREKYLQQANSLDAEWLIQALKNANDTEFKYRGATNKRLLIELLLLHIASQNLEKKNSEPHVLKEPNSSARKSVEKPAPQLAPEAAVTEDEKIATPSTEQNVEPSTKAEEVETKQPEAQESKEPSSATGTSTVEHNEDQTLTKSTDNIEQPGRRRKKRPSTISLRIDAPETDATEVAESSQTEPSHNAEQLDLATAWTQICEESLTAGNKSLYSILKKQKDIQLSNDVLTIKLAHEVDEGEFNLHGSDLLRRLRTLTGNGTMVFQTIFEADETETKLFTAKDKFEHLSKKNPALLKLRKDLDLDLTY